MFLDATTLGQMVLSKEISPLELVEDSIQKATLLNPSLNAIVYTQYEEAIEKAKRFSLKNQPFAGVPLFLKDLGQEQTREYLYLWLTFIQRCKKHAYR